MRNLAIGALACALSVSACTKVGDQTSASATAPAAGTHPGELRVAIQRAPNTLNPLLSAFTTEGLLNRLSFDVLVSIAADGKTEVPELASDVPTIVENVGEDLYAYNSDLKGYRPNQVSEFDDIMNVDI